MMMNFYHIFPSMYLGITCRGLTDYQHFFGTTKKIDLQKNII